jgi:hypothetical protein
LAALLVRTLWKTGWRAVVAGTPFQLWALTAAGVAIIPTAVVAKGFRAAYISDRMSLAVAVCLCAVLANVRMSAVERYALVAVTVLFFGFLYRDGRILNAFEDQLERAVAQLPERSRVISAVDDPDLHVNAVTHMIDRACAGRCYSFANYEPSSGMFRLRASAKNPVVAATYEQSWRLQNGTYTVQPADLPLYEVTLNESGEMAVRNLNPGELTSWRSFQVLPDLF